MLVFCADCRKWLSFYKEAGVSPRAPGAGDLLLAVEDALIAAQNAVVAAQSLGIGSCYIGDVMENAEEMKALLELPEYVYPACMLVFGYPTEQQKERKSRKDFFYPIWCVKMFIRIKARKKSGRCFQAIQGCRNMMNG